MAKTNIKNREKYRNDASLIKISDKTDITGKQVMICERRSDKVVDKISLHSFYFLYQFRSLAYNSRYN